MSRGRDATWAGRAGRAATRLGFSFTAAAAVLCLAGGTVCVTTSIVAPERVEQVIGDSRVQVNRLLLGADLPTVTLGAPGGVAELHRCTGAFTEMIRYRGQGILPLFSAHNKCGGDILLGWAEGQQLRIADREGVFEVRELRILPKGSPDAAVADLRGDLILQTCEYGTGRMRFLGVAPAVSG